MLLRLLCLSLLLVALTIGSTGCLLVAASAGAAGTVACRQSDSKTSGPSDPATVHTGTQPSVAIAPDSTAGRQPAPAPPSFATAPQQAPDASRSSGSP